MGTAPRRLLAPALVLALAAQSSADEPQIEVPIKLLGGYRVIVEGSVGVGHRLNLMIDTGAEYSVVDNAVARRISLTIIPQEVKLRAFGRETAVHRAIVPGLKVGPIAASFPCLSADIPYGGVDAIIGLDLLRRFDFTLDYKARKMVFGKSPPMEDRLPFESESRLVIVPIMVGDRTLRMSVDTGVDGICLYERNGQGWMAGQTSAVQLSVVHLGGETPGRQIWLSHFFLGSCEWMGLRAAVLRPAQSLDRDGTLGISALGLARIHFDFGERYVSWKR